MVALDGDVKNSTYTDIFEAEFPDRFIQCFVAEQNMVGTAVGLQARGKVPFAVTFGAFFTRAHDQIRMAGIGRNAVRLCGSHCGVSIGQDGPSQMALEDIAMLFLAQLFCIQVMVFLPINLLNKWVTIMMVFHTCVQRAQICLFCTVNMKTSFLASAKY